jgi:hypothetical protein
MFKIDGVKCNKILTPIVILLSDQTPTEVEDFVRTHYSEDWFNTVTPSLQGQDNRLNHRIRSIRNKLGIN